MTVNSADARELTGRPTTVAAPAGTVAGRVTDGVRGFAGIPYSAPPVGVLRWRPPAPPQRWKGTRDASRFGNDCPQQRLPRDLTPSDQPMSEDCLSLNLWAPERARRLPVMVWIHGGGFVMGSSASPVLDGAKLARRGVVLVSFNYRLGRFGFFSHPALGDGGQRSANFAFEDMIAALKWVRGNVAAFGGDPRNVTIFGESAGGAAVDFLLAAPQARGLFHKAIVQSGANREPYARLDRDRPARISADHAGAAFAASAGLSNPSAAALRALPAEAIQGKLGLLDQQPDRFTGPVIDGVTVLDDPVEQFGAGAVPRVPYLIGSNGAELSAEPFVPILLDLIKAALGPGFAALGGSYGDPPSPALIDDYYFGEAARGYARIMAGHGAPTWLYRFDHVTAAERATRQRAQHASDIAFVFGNLPPGADAQDRAVSDLLGTYWTNFARAGDPNGFGLPRWERVASGGNAALIVAAGSAATRELGNAARLDAVERAMNERRARENLQ
ncbi:carboxylesterase/lipase family protein [Novosphingobium sp. Gsoil 351]|uniref:carboxylesterase/lipase family protein n=1 Tax=Novosphingobium sp. Gsoil 351 TaxID=2675225 RepID=UPI0018A7FF57|nr:carboxylesterase family protein [Novosphingobium sp. Gsoil 351]